MRAHGWGGQREVGEEQETWPPSGLPAPQAVCVPPFLSLSSLSAPSCVCSLPLGLDSVSPCSLSVGLDSVSHNSCAEALWQLSM